MIFRLLTKRIVTISESYFKTLKNPSTDSCFPSLDWTSTTTTTTENSLTQITYLPCSKTFHTLSTPYSFVLANKTDDISIYCHSLQFCRLLRVNPLSLCYLIILGVVHCQSTLLYVWFIYIFFVSCSQEIYHYYFPPLKGILMIFICI